MSHWVPPEPATAVTAEAATDAPVGGVSPASAAVKGAAAMASLKVTLTELTGPATVPDGVAAVTRGPAVSAGLGATASPIGRTTNAPYSSEVCTAPGLPVSPIGLATELFTPGMVRLTVPLPL